MTKATGRRASKSAGMGTKVGIERRSTERGARQDRAARHGATSGRTNAHRVVRLAARSRKSSSAAAPVAIVLHGPTSAGKSSIAKALQATASVPAFHVALDAFVTMSNRRDMRSDAERDQAYHLHCDNLRATLARVAATHFDIVLDLVLRDEVELQATLGALAGRPIYLIGVSAPLAVLEARERKRGDRAAGMAREQLGHPAYARAYDLAIDTSTCTPARAAAAIRALVRSRQRPASRTTRSRAKASRAGGR